MTREEKLVDWGDNEEAGGCKPDEVLRKHRARNIVMILTEMEILRRQFR